MPQKHLYKVQFSKPIAGKCDYYFSTLTAIYEVFSHEQIGCCVRHLWNIKVSAGVAYVGRNCRITKELVTSKKNKK